MLPWPNRELARIILEVTDILSIGVPPQRQRNGIGSYLVEVVIRAVRIVDGVAVTIEVAEDNLGAAS